MRAPIARVRRSRRGRRTLRLLVLLGAVTLPGGVPALAAPAGGPAPAATSPVSVPVIVELTTPPAAAVPRAAAAAVGAAAAAQRARVRRAILDAEGRARATRGLGAPSTADVLRHEYRVVANGFAAMLLPETVQALASDPDVARIVPDGRVAAILDVSVPHVRAPEVWSDLGYRGAGATIAVLDTGVDYTHPDLGGCLGPGCKVIGGYDVINDDADPMDDHGHGTHVAATAAGDGALQGVAPDASILAYKVLNELGFGASSSVIAGIERAVDPDGNGDPSDHAAVISMSLGGEGDEDDPISTAVDVATAAGVLSVIAAGNNQAYFSIGSPGTARTALTVGATDDADEIAAFSSRGPTLVAALLKPEIAAPGVGICAARLATAYADRLCLDSEHAALNGTSMATPHVAGAATLVRGVAPALSPAEAKAILQQAAVPVGLGPTTGGAGRLDARAALDVRTVLSPAPINLGIDDGADAIWERTAAVTVRNLGPAETAYSLAFDATGLPAGVSAEIVPDQVLVAAGGAAEVALTVTVDNAQVPLSVAAPYLYVGRLVASAPGEEEAVLVAFAHEPPPPNDLCANAFDLGAGAFGAWALAVRATAGPDDPESECGCAMNAKSLWYRVTPPVSGTVRLDTGGSSYSTVLGVFTGSCGALRAVECSITDPFDTQRSFEAKAGTTYYVEVASYCTLPASRLQLEIDVPGPRPAVSAALTEIFRMRTADLAGARLRFTPDGASYSVCVEFADAFPTDPAGGASLPLTIDSFVPVALAGGETVALYGERYGELFVGSNGYVTFGAGETESGPSFVSYFGLPTIAPFSTRMLVSPLHVGDVSWKQLADRVALTWDGVQSIEPGAFIYPFNRFQLELLFDGQIRMSFLETGWHGLTGLSPGGGVPVLFRETNFFAIPHCGAPAGGEVPLGGKRFTFKESALRPQATKLKVVLAPPDPPAVPAPGGSADPTLHGAAFELYNPQTSEFTTIPLPAAAWTALTSSSGSVTYQYRDRHAAFGPCAKVDVAARGVRVQCGRAALGFTLNEFTQGRLATSLTLGSTSTGMRVCSVFGGTVRQDVRGAFKAKKAEVPERCWLPESYY